MARWLASSKTLLWGAGILHQKATVLELGCGIAGIIGLSLYRLVDTYVLTDQEYVLKRLQANVNANMGIGVRGSSQSAGRLCVASLDWEKDKVSNVRTAINNDASIDLVIACDCIYNDFLVQPFVETCRDICKLSRTKRTLLLVAQQLRSDDVLAQWLTASLQHFDVWRVPNEHLSDELVSGTGFALHLLLLKGNRS